MPKSFLCLEIKYCGPQTKSKKIILENFRISLIFEPTFYNLKGHESGLPMKALFGSYLKFPYMIVEMSMNYDATNVSFFFLYSGSPRNWSFRGICEKLKLAAHFKMFLKLAVPQIGRTIIIK